MKKLIVNNRKNYYKIFIAGTHVTQGFLTGKHGVVTSVRCPHGGCLTG